ncbi:MAG: response regulator [Anaerolineae bacterium]|nr:response regulator [Anaerolineae bacterium]
MMAYALVVEDDAEIARFVELVLQETAFEVAVVYDGQAALDQLAARPPNLVLLDLNLPKVSGLEVLHHIRQTAALADVRVIVISANPHMVDQAYDEADLILQKPISYDQLRDLVRRFG